MVSVTDKDRGWAAMMNALAGSGADTLAAYIGPDYETITSDTVKYREKVSEKISFKRTTNIDPLTGKLKIPKSGYHGEWRSKAKYKTTKEQVRGQRDYYPIYVEYGTRKMAARPFIRFTLDAHDNYLPELRALAIRVFRRAKDGDVFLSMAASLRGLANSVARDIKQTIKGLGAIDTSRMYHSVKCLRVVSGDAHGRAGQLVETMTFGGAP